MRPVLKYPGSKWKIAGELVGLIPEHHSYVEPYFRSGAVLFNKPPSAIETVNDLDSDVVNLFECIQQDPGRLARLVMTTPFSRETYDRRFPAEHSGEDIYQKAVGFLVRCNQAHGSRNDGYKAGWKYDLDRREKMYALWDWYDLPARIVEVAERLRRVQIEHRPALEVIRNFDRCGVFMYIDPPYLLETRSGKQYRHEMTAQGHVELLQVIRQSRAKVMISGYASALYDEILSGWRKEHLKSCAEGGKPRTEVVWMKYDPPQRQLSLFDEEESEGVPS